MRDKTPIIIIILITIVLLAAYYLLGMGYMKQRKEHEALSSQISNVTQMLAQIPAPPRDLEQRLAATRASLAAEQNKLGRMTSTEVVDTILKLADGSNVKAIPLATQPWSTEKVGEHAYHVFRLNVAVEGSFSQLVSFVSKLEYGEFKTLVVENLSVARAGGQSEESISERTIPVTASLRLTIYTQPLTSD